LGAPLRQICTGTSALRKSYRAVSARQVTDHSQDGGCFKDITERVKLNRQMLHAQKMESVGRLAGGVAIAHQGVLDEGIQFISEAFPWQ